MSSVHISDAERPCTCWEVQTADGSTTTLGWVDLHEYVSVATRDGNVVEGFSVGACTSISGARSRDTYEVQVDGDSGTTSIPREDICSITPDGGFDSVEAILHRLEHLLKDPMAMQQSEKPTYLRYVIGSHEAVEIEVRHFVGRCSPPKPGRMYASLGVRTETLP